MPVNDPIADYLTRIRNAAKAKHKSLDIPSSKLKVAISQLLKDKGYIVDFAVDTDGKFQVLKLKLKYDAYGQHAIKGLERVSTSGKRVYSGKEIKPYLRGIGMYVISTSRGLLSDKEARAAGVGGEVLFRLY